MGVDIAELSVEDLCRLVRSDPVWGKGKLRFVGDIGGTNARCGFAKSKSTTELMIIFCRFDMSKKDIRQVFDFFQVLVDTITEANLRGRVTSGGLSVPGPVSGGGKVAGPFNNLKGVLHLADFPELLFPDCKAAAPQYSAMMNDLEAGANGILAVNQNNAFGDVFDTLWEGTLWKDSVGAAPVGSTLGKGHCLVLAPGTGLGASLIFYSPKQSSYTIVPLEVGSVSTPARFGDISVPDFSNTHGNAVVINHADYIAECAEHFKTGVPNVEQISTGSILQHNYAFFQRVLGEQPTDASISVIARGATDGTDRAATFAMALMHFFFFSASAEFCMTFLPLTCVLIGDNVVQNSSFITQPNVQQWLAHEAVYQHPMEKDKKFLSRTSFLYQKTTFNTNIVGCALVGSEYAPAVSSL